ncbi:cystathionine gamma-synthase [Wenzhouxiangella sp. AB-CW3]|uniref:cystathionine gamma-synthase n=1 Tax=Wenzhouxiangella sp. AB-CW3 TaxID=2771012 RepID=UPI00168B8EEE|nr:cystathionine gamma-synthase [Wenzhouxiangella sp. AB-CW3]
MTREAYQPETVAVRTGIESDTQHGAVVPPIHLSSTYSFADYGQPRRYDYSRSGNPTRDQLGHALRDLEGGTAATVTATGMGAISTVLQLLKPGQRLIAPVDCYGGTFRLFDAWHRKGLFELEWVDYNDTDAFEQALAAGAALVWVETPSNPLLRIYDIRAIARAAHAVGALVVADNTFLSPVLQQPLALGADLVVHSTTKYINGHSDVVGGAIIAADESVGEEIAWWSNTMGISAGPFDSWLTLRGLRTLGPRLRQHQENTAAVVEVLMMHDAISQVYYPGLTSHPGHALASRQQRGFGAMVSFELDGGEVAVRRFLKALQLPSLAESLGGVETLIAHPATMTHAAMSLEARQRAGITDGLLRLSVGLEAAEDLCADLHQALAQLTPGQSSPKPQLKGVPGGATVRTG